MVIRSRRKSVPLPSTPQPPSPTPSPLSRITEATIRDLATDRGMDYYNRGAIDNPTQQDDRIWADCYGSDHYHTSARFVSSNERVTADEIELDCSCPYSFGGACKHQVALLLTYLYEPNTFHVIPPLRDLLANHSREDLLRLLEKILQQSPELIDQLEIAAAISPPQASGKPIDPRTYRSQMRRLLKKDNFREILKAIEPITQRADQFYASEDFLNAGQLYQVVLSEITIAYDGELQEVDYDGYLIGLTQEIVVDLGNCLSQESIDPAARQDWIQTLLDGILKDVDLGGVEFATGAADFLIELATDAEWTSLESQLRQTLSHASGSWVRDFLASILARRLEQVGELEAADDIILALSSPEKQIFTLVKRGKIDQAIAQVKEVLPQFSGWVSRFADALIEVGESKKALQFITELYEDPTVNIRRLEDWLAKYHHAQGNLKTALKFEEAIFLQNPYLARYIQIQELANSIGNWNRVRSRLLKPLTEGGKWSLLIEIAIHEQNSKQAFKLLNNLSSYQQMPFKLKIAPISEPAIAIAIYEEVIHEAISRKNRSAYQEAVRYLRLIQQLQNVSQTSQDWKDYIQNLLAQYPTLKALREEISKL